MENDREGPLCRTTLGREAQPLLRYRSGDVVRILGTDSCACGRTGFRFHVLGRSDDMLIVKGINVFPAPVEEVLAELRPDLTGAFQILLPRPGPLDSLSTRAEHGEAIGPADLDGLRARAERRLREILVAHTEVELIPPNRLPRFEGKAKCLIRLYAGKQA